LYRATGLDFKRKPERVSYYVYIYKIYYILISHFNYNKHVCFDLSRRVSMPHWVHRNNRHRRLVVLWWGAPCVYYQEYNIHIIIPLQWRCKRQVSDKLTNTYTYIWYRCLSTTAASAFYTSICILYTTLHNLYICIIYCEVLVCVVRTFLIIKWK